MPACLPCKEERGVDMASNRRPSREGNGSWISTGSTDHITDWGEDKLMNSSLCTIGNSRQEQGKRHRTMVDSMAGYRHGENACHPMKADSEEGKSSHTGVNSATPSKFALI
jgi:hypothetical protein